MMKQILIESVQKQGGTNTAAEVDELKYGHRKHNRCRLVEVFGFQFYRKNLQRRSNLVPVKKEECDDNTTDNMEEC